MSLLFTSGLRLDLVQHRGKSMYYFCNLSQATTYYFANFPTLDCKQFSHICWTGRKTDHLCGVNPYRIHEGALLRVDGIQILILSLIRQRSYDEGVWHVEVTKAIDRPVFLVRLQRQANYCYAAIRFSARLRIASSRCHLLSVEKRNVSQRREERRVSCEQGGNSDTFLA